MATSMLLRGAIEEVGYLTRTQKNRCDRELNEALKPIDALGEDAQATRDAAAAAVGGTLERLRALKRRVASTVENDDMHFRSTRSRILGSSPKPEADEPVPGHKHWDPNLPIDPGQPEAEAAAAAAAEAKTAAETASTRVLDELLIDYMLRQDLDGVALDLAKGGRAIRTRHLAAARGAKVASCGAQEPRDEARPRVVLQPQSAAQEARESVGGPAPPPRFRRPCREVRGDACGRVRASALPDTRRGAAGARTRRDGCSSPPTRHA